LSQTLCGCVARLNQSFLSKVMAIWSWDGQISIFISSISLLCFLFLSSFSSLSLSSLFLYMKIDEKGLVICGFSIFEFWFLNLWIGMNELWDRQSVEANIIGEIGYIRFFAYEHLLTVFYKKSLAKPSAKTFPNGFFIRNR
jgi:hypothetical protein